MGEQLEFDWDDEYVLVPAGSPILKTPQTMVEEFHHATDSDIDVRTYQSVSLRFELIYEEFTEMADELNKTSGQLAWDEPVKNLGSLAKELADLLYVVYGTGVALGIDLEAAFRRVHESNMSKLVDGKAVFREDGKVLKGPNYVEPDMTGVYREEEDDREG